MSKDIAADYEKLMGLREGAHYARMDLHTHTPASECSSFELPKVLAELIPPIKSSLPAQKRGEALTLLQRLRDGEPVFDEAAAGAAAQVLWWGPPAQIVDSEALADTARLWLADIGRLEDPDSKQATPLLKSAFQDIRNVITKTFFPPEFVLRCYIEQLEVVALTDHNHPGYIVPRLPQLGTWFDAISQVNEGFLKDIREGEPPGAKVRGMILARLEKAKKKPDKSTTLQSATDPETKKNHKDSKKLKAREKRQAHITERLAIWKNHQTPLRPLNVLPGTEITVSNIHCLAIFPPDWMVPGRIAAILRDIGIDECIWGKGFEAAADSSIQHTIDLVDQANGIAIPAHSNSDFKGLLRLFRKGLALDKVLEHPALLALEKIDGKVLAEPKNKKIMDACETLRWLDTNARAPQRSKLLMFIKGSDAHECRLEVDGTGEDLGMRFTWIKMDLRQRDTPSEVFRALRLALLSGQGRVVEVPTEDTYNYGAHDSKNRADYTVGKKSREKLLDWTQNHPAILGLMVRGKGSYSDGLEIRFNPFMNCLAGAEGKSTVLRLLAYAFGALSFLPDSKEDWLPQNVRVFWRDRQDTFCIERQGRNPSPDDPSIQTTLYQLDQTGKWSVQAKGEQAGQKVRDVIEIWPGTDALAMPGKSSKLSDAELGRLVKLLTFSKDGQTKPLLVHQPREIFHSYDLFQQVLRRPALKFRQIIWATVSPNVPTALDADKIIVTAEKRGRGKRKMEVVCGGDLHEDEVIRDYLNQVEGGYAGFARRKILYEACAPGR